jgi:hypothetical protein
MLWSLVCALAVLPPSAASAQERCSDANLLAGAQPIAQPGTRGDAALLTDQHTAAEGARWDAQEDEDAFCTCRHTTVARFDRVVTSHTRLLLVP